VSLTKLQLLKLRSLPWWDQIKIKARKPREYKPFEEARDFARSQGVNSKIEYQRWARAKNIAGMPVAPEQVYKDKGWVDWFDFLGIQWLPFTEAKVVVREHGIKTQTQFRAWRERLINIPSNPNHVYKNAGWIDWYDFLSKESPSLRHVQTAERLAAEHGILPRVMWLRDNGHGALCQHMRAHPGAFAHIPQREFERYADCHSDRKHQALGLCKSCYYRKWYENRRQENLEREL